MRRTVRQQWIFLYQQAQLEDLRRTLALLQSPPQPPPPPPLELPVTTFPPPETSPPPMEPMPDPVAVIEAALGLSTSPPLRPTSRV